MRSFLSYIIRPNNYSLECGKMTLESQRLCQNVCQKIRIQLFVYFWVLQGVLKNNKKYVILLPYFFKNEVRQFSGCCKIAAIYCLFSGRMILFSVENIKTVVFTCYFNALVFVAHNCHLFSQSVCAEKRTVGVLSTSQLTYSISCSFPGLNSRQKKILLAYWSLQDN